MMQQWLINYAKEIEKDFPEYMNLSKKVKMSSQVEYEDYQFGDIFSIKLKNYNHSISFTLYEGTIRKDELLFEHFCAYSEKQQTIEALLIHNDPRLHAIIPIGEKTTKLSNRFSSFQDAMIGVDGKISWNTRFIHPLFFTFDLIHEQILVHDEKKETIYHTFTTCKELNAFYEGLQTKEEEMNQAIDHLLHVLKKDFPNAYLNKHTRQLVAFGEVLSFVFNYKQPTFSFSLIEWDIFCHSASLDQLIEKVEDAMKPHIQKRRIRSMFQ